MELLLPLQNVEAEYDNFLISRQPFYTKYYWVGSKTTLKQAFCALIWSWKAARIQELDSYTYANFNSQAFLLSSAHMAKTTSFPSSSDNERYIFELSHNNINAFTHWQVAASTNLSKNGGHSIGAVLGELHGHKTLRLVLAHDMQSTWIELQCTLLLYLI